MGYMGATVHLDKNEEEQIKIGLPYSCGHPYKGTSCGV